MTILCGTDLSAPARQALVAAVHIARARKTRVRLVNVIDIPGAGAVLAERVVAQVTDFFEAEERRRLAQLEDEARELRQIAPIECAVVGGEPAEALVAAAAAAQAEVLVVSAIGARGDRTLRLGHVADRVAQTARCPVLVVRDAEPFRAWDESRRALRVLVGLDLTPTSDAALRWVASVPAAAASEIFGCHVFWPPDARERFHKRGLPIGSGDAEVASALEAELRARIASVAPGLAVSTRLVGGMGRVASHVLEVARDVRADLLVIGTHQRQGLERLWTGSVSRDAIVGGDCNVAVVPVP